MPLRRRSGRRLALAAALLVAAMTGCTPDAASDAGEPGLLRISDRELASPIAGRTLDGDKLALVDLRGAPVVINVWGSWCAPCRKEQPELVRAANALAPLGVRFVGIDIKDKLSAARAWVRSFDVPYPSWFDQGQRLVAQLGVSVQFPPTTILIDRSGRIAATLRGSTTERELTELVRELAAEEA